MPLQPPSPDFLSQAPTPAAEPSRRGSSWRRPAGITGLLMLILAMLFGIPELLT